MTELAKERALRRFSQVLHELAYTEQGDVSDKDALRAFRHMARDALDTHYPNERFSLKEASE